MNHAAQTPLVLELTGDDRDGRHAGVILETKSPGKRPDCRRNTQRLESVR